MTRGFMNNLLAALAAELNPCTPADPRSADAFGDDVDRIVADLTPIDNQVRVDGVGPGHREGHVRGPAVVLDLELTARAGPVDLGVAPERVAAGDHERGGVARGDGRVD